MHVIRLDSAGRVRLIPSVKLAFRGLARSRVLDGSRRRPTGRARRPRGICRQRPGCSCGGAERRGNPTSAPGRLHGRTRQRGLMAETERSLADEAAGPLAQLVAIPQDGGDGGDADPLAGAEGGHSRRRGARPYWSRPRRRDGVTGERRRHAQGDWAGFQVGADAAGFHRQGG